MTDDRKDENPSAPHRLIRSVYAALAAEPEKGLVRRSGRTSAGIPAALQAGDMRDDSASAAPDDENIDTAHMMRDRDGIRERAVSSPDLAPLINAPR